MTGQTGKERTQGNLVNVYIKTWRESAMKAEPGSSQWSHEAGPESMGPNWNTGCFLQHQETFFFSFFTSECNWALAQIATRSCWVSIHRDTLKPSDHGTGQLAWPVVLTQMTSRGSFKPNHVVTLFCDMQCGICCGYFRWITSLPKGVNCFF